jgi:hypothetical protein
LSIFLWLCSGHETERAGMGMLFRLFSAVDFKQVFDPKQDETIQKKTSKILQGFLKFLQGDKDCHC